MNATGPVDQNTSANSNGSSGSAEPETIPKGLLSWREAVQRSVTSSQLSMALYTLEQCVAWDKSIMKAVSHGILFYMPSDLNTFFFTELPVLSIRRV